MCYFFSILEFNTFLKECREKIDNVNTSKEAYSVYHEIYGIYYENLLKYGMDDLDVKQVSSLSSEVFRKHVYLEMFEEKGKDFIDSIKSDLKGYLDSVEVKLGEVQSYADCRKLRNELINVLLTVEYFEDYLKEWNQEYGYPDIDLLREKAYKKEELLLEREKAEKTEDKAPEEPLNEEQTDTEEVVFYEVEDDSQKQEEENVAVNDSQEQPEEQKNTVKIHSGEYILDDDEYEEDYKEEQEDYEEKKTFFSKLRELITIDWQLTMLHEACRRNRVNIELKNAKNGTEKYLSEQAKRYGVRKEAYKKIYEEFEETLEQAKEEYTNTRNEILEEKGENEQDEIDAKGDLYNKNIERRKYIKSPEYKKIKAQSKALIKQIDIAMKNGDKEELEELFIKSKELQDNNKLYQYDKDISELKEKITTARENIKTLKNNMKQLENNYKNIISNANEMKGNDIATVEKQSIFGKFIGAISSITKKLGNKEGKFQKDVVNPIKESLGKMKKGIKSFGKGMVGVGQKIVDGGQKTADFMKSIPKGIGNTVKGIATFFKNKKDAIVDKMENALDRGIEKRQHQLDKYKEDDEVEQGN